MDIPLWQTISLQLLLQVALILLNAVFACAEIAVIETKETRLEKLASGGDKRAAKLIRLTANPAKFLATIQVAITLSGFLASAFAAENFSVYIVGALHGRIGLSDSVINTVSVILITIVLSYFTLVFGELVPKRLAMKKPERIALKLSGVIALIAKAFAPLVWLLTASTNAMLRALKVDPNAEEAAVSEEDIRMMADAGSEKGYIDEAENEMIQNIFEFDDITLERIATHRTEMEVLWESDADAEWESTIIGNIHSYYPVCGEDIDSVTGMLNADIYLRLSDRSRENVMRLAVEKPRFAAEVTKADALFHSMKREKFTVAVVVDEYGGTSGIVTLNDLIEQIVGDLDEQETQRDIVRDGSGYTISGQADRECLDELFGIETGTDSATLGGWVMENLEKIPEAGDELVVGDVRIVVTRADSTRVLEVRAERLNKASA